MRRRAKASSLGGGVDLASIDGFHVGFKVFDYGVISLRLTREFSGTWRQLTELSSELVENEALERQAEQACRIIAGWRRHRIAAARRARAAQQAGTRRDPPSSAVLSR